MGDFVDGVFVIGAFVTLPYQYLREFRYIALLSKCIMHFPLNNWHKRLVCQKRG